MRSGGIYPVFLLATQAELFGINCQIGSMVESSIASAAGFHVAVSKEYIISTEISGPMKFNKDIVDLSYSLPYVHVPNRIELGIEVNEQNLQALTITTDVIKLKD